MYSAIKELLKKQYLKDILLFIYNIYLIKECQNEVSP